MKNILLSLVTTNKGWLVRQALKGVTAASASVSTYLLTKGADAELVHSAAAGLIAAASWSLETGLSFVARKYTVN